MPRCYPLRQALNYHSGSETHFQYAVAWCDFKEVADPGAAISIHSRHDDATQPPEQTLRGPNACIKMFGMTLIDGAVPPIFCEIARLCRHAAPKPRPFSTPPVRISSALSELYGTRLRRCLADPRRGWRSCMSCTRWCALSIWYSMPRGPTRFITGIHWSATFRDIHVAVKHNAAFPAQYESAGKSAGGFAPYRHRVVIGCEPMPDGARASVVVPCGHPDLKIACLASSHHRPFTG